MGPGKVFRWLQLVAGGSMGYGQTNSVPAGSVWEAGRRTEERVWSCVAIMMFFGDTHNITTTNN